MARVVESQHSIEAGQHRQRLIDGVGGNRSAIWKAFDQTHGVEAEVADPATREGGQRQALRMLHSVPLDEVAQALERVTREFERRRSIATQDFETIGENQHSAGGRGA